MKLRERARGYLQPAVTSPARAIGLPLMKTLLPPPTTTPPQVVLPPVTVAGFPLMKTLLDPSTIEPSEVVSPARADGLPPTVTLSLPPVTTPGVCACDGVAARMSKATAEDIRIMGRPRQCSTSNSMFKVTADQQWYRTGLRRFDFSLCSNALMVTSRTDFRSEVEEDL